jgi:hypothetical protein
MERRRQGGNEGGREGVAHHPFSLFVFLEDRKPTQHSKENMLKGNVWYLGNKILFSANILLFGLGFGLGLEHLQPRHHILLHFLLQSGGRGSCGVL